MNELALQQVKVDVGRLLAKPLEGVDIDGLKTLIDEAVAGEREARKLAHGGHSTLLLNGLLAAERDIRTKVYGLPPEPIKPDF